MRKFVGFGLFVAVLLSPVVAEAGPLRRLFGGRTVASARVYTATPAGSVRASGRVVSQSGGSLYQQALASAQYRAANRIHGHSHLDTGRRSGVGWASHDASPATCLGRGGANYAVVRGPDGWYSTKF